MAELTENQLRLCEALESGEFEQGYHALCINGKYCCLGVAQELMVRDGLLAKRLSGLGDTFTFFDPEDEPDEERLVLTRKARQWLNVSDSNPSLGETFRIAITENSRPVQTGMLASMNDGKVPFPEIAALIREHGLV